MVLSCLVCDGLGPFTHLGTQVGGALVDRCILTTR